MRYGCKIMLNSGFARKCEISVASAVFLNFIIDSFRFLAIYNFFPEEFDGGALSKHLFRHIKSHFSSPPYTLILMIIVGIIARNLMASPSAKNGFVAFYVWALFCVAYLQSLTFASAFEFSPEGFWYWMFVAGFPGFVLFFILIAENVMTKNKIGLAK